MPVRPRHRPTRSPRLAEAKNRKPIKALHSGTVKGEGHDTDLMRNETIKPFVAELEQSL